MKKIISATILSISALTFSNIVTVEANTFTDVSSVHWAYDSIVNLSGKGIINGYADGSYYPNKTVSRAEFATIMSRCAGISQGNSTTSIYSDVNSSHWALPYINATSAYMTAYKSSSGSILFKPDEGALREDIAVALVKLKGYDVNSANTSLLSSKFTDTTSISSSALPYVAIAVEKGLINGYEDGTFRPNNSITRAEAAVLLERVIINNSDDKIIVGDLNNSDDKIIVDDILNAQSTPATTPEYAPNVPTTMPEYAPDVPTTMPEYAPDVPTTIPEIEVVLNKVSTVAQFPKNIDDYVITKDLDIYYLQNNKLMKQDSTGNTSTIYDGNSYSAEKKSRELMEMTDLSSEYNKIWYDEYQITYADKEDSKVYYIDKMYLSDITYDNATNEVYMKTVYETHGISTRNSSIATCVVDALYNVKNMNNPVYEVSILAGNTGTYKEQKTSTQLLANNNIVFFNNFSHLVRVDTNSKIATKYTGDISIQDNRTNNQMYINNDLYEFGGFSGYRKYNISTDSWTKTSIANGDSSGNSGHHAVYNNKLYYIENTGLFKIEEAGTDRVKYTQILEWGDLNIEDGLPINNVKSFQFDSNGDIVFLDGSSYLLRKIEIDKSLLN